MELIIRKVNSYDMFKKRKAFHCCCFMSSTYLNYFYVKQAELVFRVLLLLMCTNFNTANTVFRAEKQVLLSNIHLPSTPSTHISKCSDNENVTCSNRLIAANNKPSPFISQTLSVHSMNNLDKTNNETNLKNLLILLNSNVNNFSSMSSPNSNEYNFSIKLIISSVLSILIICTIVGNIFVIIAISLDKNLQSAQNYLILSLAVADLTVALLVMPLGAAYEVLQKWALGSELCTFWTLADVFSCTASILHLLAIALDRYWSVSSLYYNQGRSLKRMMYTIAAIWLAAACVSMPPIFGLKDPEFESRLQSGRCLMSQDVGYQIFATMSTFYAPSVIILLLYWKIYQVARKRIRNKPGNQNLKSLGKSKSPNSKNERISDKLLTDLHTLSTISSIVPSTDSYMINKSVGCGKSTNKKKNHLVKNKCKIHDVNSFKNKLNLKNRECKYNETTLSELNSNVIIYSSEMDIQTETHFDDNLNQASTTKSNLKEIGQENQKQINSNCNNFFKSNNKHRKHKYSTKLSQTNLIENNLTKSNSTINNNSEALSSLQKGSIKSMQDECNVKNSSYEYNTSELNSDQNNSLRKQTVLYKNKTHSSNAKKEHKTAKILAIITGVFMICWLPFFINALLMAICPNKIIISDLLFSILLWLGYTNSLLNPIIYTIFSPDFRNAFKRLLTKCKN